MQLGKFVKFREEQFGGVLFETRSEKVYTLNPAAAAVVRELRTGADEAAIKARVKALFQDPSGTLEQDVTDLLADLRAKGLLKEDAA